MELFVLAFALPALGWLYYRLQRKIGENQQLEREDWKREHPQYFPKVRDDQRREVDDAETKKFIEGVWARYYAHQAAYREQKEKEENESKSNIRKK